MFSMASKAVRESSTSLVGVLDSLAHIIIGKLFYSSWVLFFAEDKEASMVNVSAKIKIFEEFW